MYYIKYLYTKSKHLCKEKYHLLISKHHKYVTPYLLCDMSRISNYFNYKYIFYTLTGFGILLHTIKLTIPGMLTKIY